MLVVQAVSSKNPSARMEPRQEGSLTVTGWLSKEFGSNCVGHGKCCKVLEEVEVNMGNKRGVLGEHLRIPQKTKGLVTKDPSREAQDFRTLT